MVLLFMVIGELGLRDNFVFIWIIIFLMDRLCWIFLLLIFRLRLFFLLILIMIKLELLLFVRFCVDLVEWVFGNFIFIFCVINGDVIIKIMRRISIMLM